MELRQAWPVDQRCLRHLSHIDLVLFILPSRQSPRCRAHELECGDLLLGTYFRRGVLLCPGQADLCWPCHFGQELMRWIDLMEWLMCTR